MLTAPLCRCICGARKGDLDPGKGLSEHDIFSEVAEDVSFHQSQHTGLLLYLDSADQPLRGVPIREGPLFLLSAEEEVQITLSLHINGLAFNHRGREVSVSLSPFSLVRNCKFQNSDLGGAELADFKCFKVSLFTLNICFYFGVRSKDDREAEDDRSQWVHHISRAMRLVTQSLFPPHRIACDPVGSMGSTHRRLMAGYLLHSDGGSVASVLYCELHPQSSDGTAKLVLYENELCEEHVVDVYITERSCCSEKVGIDCACFSVEDHLFSSRTLPERRLWLRAISNLKVKLQNRAPSPTQEELVHYRIAIQEHIRTSGKGFATHSYEPMDALLKRYAVQVPTAGFLPEMLNDKPGEFYAATGYGSDVPPDGTGSNSWKEKQAQASDEGIPVEAVQAAEVSQATCERSAEAADKAGGPPAGPQAEPKAEPKPDDCKGELTS
mmetsp:Transcript_30371/g.66508  ORF Transcript_30371/g.66508 Transcript_30371/m.66508 type:complete len:439 (-) Transcript_30371:25-1341(-)